MANLSWHSQVIWQIWCRMTKVYALDTIVIKPQIEMHLLIILSFDVFVCAGHQPEQQQNTPTASVRPSCVLLQIPEYGEPSNAGRRPLIAGCLLSQDAGWDRIVASCLDFQRNWVEDIDSRLSIEQDKQVKLPLRVPGPATVNLRMSKRFNWTLLPTTLSCCSCIQRIYI